MADETNPILAVLERARVEPWSVGGRSDGTKYGEVTIDERGASKWNHGLTTDDGFIFDPDVADAIVLAVNHHAALREALVAQSNAVEELLATQAIPVVVWAGLQDVLDQARAALRALDEALANQGE